MPALLGFYGNVDTFKKVDKRVGESGIALFFAFYDYRWFSDLIGIKRMI
jgi:hypothetical protein